MKLTPSQAFFGCVEGFYKSRRRASKVAMWEKRLGKLSLDNAVVNLPCTFDRGSDDLKRGAPRLENGECVGLSSAGQIRTCIMVRKLVT